METSDVNVGPGSHHLFAACCLHCVLFLWPFLSLLPCFNHFLTLNMEVEPYQFESTVSEEESSASDDSSMYSWMMSTRIELVMWDGEGFVHSLCCLWKVGNKYC